MQFKLNIDVGEVEINEAYYTTLQALIETEIERELREQVRENLRFNKEVRALADKIGGIVIAELTLSANKKLEED
jgi:hypothetical protein